MLQPFVTTSRRFLLALPLLYLAACGTDEGPEPAMEEATPPAETAPPPGEMLHATVVLQQVNGSGVTGEAMAMHSDDAVVVIVELEGLPDEGEYPAHIHVGSCADGGPVGAPLDPIVGLADGTGLSTTTLEMDELDPDESHFIMVHGEGGAAIVCGDLAGHGA